MTSRPPASSRLRLALLMVAAVAASPLGAAADAPDQPAGHEEPAVLIPTAWLGDPITVEQAEADHPGISDERFPEATRPFGFSNGRWEALKAKMRAGDELRSFASPPDSWQHLAGRAGIALVRGGTVIDMLVTIMN